MKYIPLTKGFFAIVDDEDFEQLNKYKWHVLKCKHGYYAKRTFYDGNKRTDHLMHRYILGITIRSIHVDHKNHNTLDNRRDNLRICSNAQNCCNKKSAKGSSSKYLGVSVFHNGKKRTEKWKSQIRISGKSIHLGIFYNEEDAAKAYDIAAIKYHGEFANLNFK